MNEIDYEELIRSPLDGLEESTGDRWAIALLGVVLGLAVGLPLTSGLREGAEDAPVVTIADTAAVVAVVSAEAADYPQGFTEIAPGLAAYPGEVILGDQVVTVGFTTAVVRGQDPAEAAWPAGGSWLLTSGSGVVVESSRVNVGRFHPGVFAVQFPAEGFNGDTEFTNARAVERWDTEYFAGSTTMPYDEEPFAIAEALSIPVSQGVTLIIPKLELGRFLGSVEWQTAGADLGTTVSISATLLGADGEAIGSYSRFPEILAPGDSGVLEIFWQEPFPTDQEGAVELLIEYEVGVVSETPVSINFDLSDVPVGR